MPTPIDFIIENRNTNVRLTKYPKFPCSVCSRNVTYNNPSILCSCCDLWVHIKCTDLWVHIKCTDLWVHIKCTDLWVHIKCTDLWVHIKCTDLTLDDYNHRIEQNNLNPALTDSEAWNCPKCTIVLNVHLYPFGLLSTPEVQGVAHRMLVKF